jgi:hypothetical protein
MGSIWGKPPIRRGYGKSFPGVALWGLRGPDGIEPVFGHGYAFASSSPRFSPEHPEDTGRD